MITAFLAAAVVGLFESTITKYTALAVLLPVVAGQSGNTGAHALAVTMRGLALREIRIRQWPRVVFKEASTAFLNGLAVAATTALGLWVWSSSVGLAGVIGISMILSMVIAGVAGAAIPLLLTAARQDPAQSSSIVLTTVTDVAGFFSFLGIASLFAERLSWFSAHRSVMTDGRGVACGSRELPGGTLHVGADPVHLAEIRGHLNILLCSASEVSPIRRPADCRRRALIRFMPGRDAWGFTIPGSTSPGRPPDLPMDFQRNRFKRIGFAYQATAQCTGQCCSSRFCVS